MPQGLKLSPNFQITDTNTEHTTNKFTWVAGVDIQDENDQTKNDKDLTEYNDIQEIFCEPDNHSIPNHNHEPLHHQKEIMKIYQKKKMHMKIYMEMMKIYQKKK